MKPEIRDLTESDAAALQDFLVAMPPEDRTFFFWDVDDPTLAKRWTGDDRRRSRAAFDPQGRMLAFAALQPGVDWSRHVVDLVLAVAPGQRRQGLGKLLARAMLIEALERGFKKVTVMIAADNAGAINMFRDLGFDGEALLRDHLCSPADGTLRDVVMLAHLVEETWSSMRTGGFEEALR